MSFLAAVISRACYSKTHVLLFQHGREISGNISYVVEKAVTLKKLSRRIAVRRWSSKGRTKGKNGQYAGEKNPLRVPVSCYVRYNHAVIATLNH